MGEHLDPNAGAEPFHARRYSARAEVVTVLLEILNFWELN